MVDAKDFDQDAAVQRFELRAAQAREQFELAKQSQDRRDRFELAKAAMQSLIPKPQWTETEHLIFENDSVKAEFAKDAWAWADAMMKGRE